MAKPTGRRRVSGEGRQEKKHRRQPYDYDFKLKVINYYATAGISATTARFFSSTDDGPRGSKRCNGALRNDSPQNTEHTLGAYEEAISRLGGRTDDLRA